MPPLSTRHATAFITGASSGIGRAFAEMLLAEGVRVWGTARNVSRLAPLAQKFPGTFFPVALDLANPGAAQSIFDRAADDASATGTTADALGLARSFDLVINNAGFGLFGPFATAEFAAWRLQLDTMLAAAALLSQTALRSMLARNRGCLVNVSSLAAEFPLPFMSGYNIAKAGLSALSESLIFETRGTRVRVIDFRPGDYRTGFNKVMQGGIEGGSGVPPLGLDAETEKRQDAASTFNSASNDRVARAWRTINAQFDDAPPPARAARDLRRALLRGRSGIVRSGTFFQARLAPLAARLLPARMLRALAARYFGAA